MSIRISPKTKETRTDEKVPEGWKSQVHTNPIKPGLESFWSIMELWKVEMMTPFPVAGNPRIRGEIWKGERMKAFPQAGYQNADSFVSQHTQCLPLSIKALSPHIPPQHSYLTLAEICSYSSRSPRARAFCTANPSLML